MVANPGKVGPMSLYRVRQFLQALTARHLWPAEQGEVKAVLQPAGVALFQRMSPYDQRHSLQVMRTLMELDQVAPALLTAALLHDVGKSYYPLRLWERPLVVLARLIQPVLVQDWGNGTPRGWRRPFVIYENHAKWGAQMAAEAGCSSQVVWLVANHHASVGLDGGNEQERAWLQALQLADGAN